MKGYYLMPHPPIMVHEVGNGREAEIQKTIDSCRKIGREIENSDADTIIIITPHGTVFRDAVSLIDIEYLQGDFGRFGAEEVSFNMKINTELTREIIRKAEQENISTVGLNHINAQNYGIHLELDHGAMVPLYNIDNVEKYKLVHITYGMLSPMELYSFGMIIDKAVRELKVNAVLIASGDLSHRLTHEGTYPYSPHGAEFDNALIDIINEGKISKIFSMDNTMIKEAGECGLRSLYILCGTLDGKSVSSEVLSYEGPFGVGYGVAKFKAKDGKSIYEELKNTHKEEHKRRIKEGNIYTSLARRNIDYFFDKRRSLSLEDIHDDKLLNDKKGVFVSLKINNELRGCIGTIQGVTSCIGEEILKNSISAAFNDPRFSPLKQNELYECDISVDILYEPEVCTFEDLDPKNYGVIVTYGRKRGLLLPNLEGVDTKEAQVEIALQKAGIRNDEDYHIERFKVERFKEVNDSE